MTSREKLFALEIACAILFGPVVAHQWIPGSTTALVLSVPVMLIIIGAVVLAIEIIIALLTGKRLNKKANRLQGQLNSLQSEYNKAAGTGSNKQPKKKKRKKK